jgi:hypothetical protein
VQSPAFWFCCSWLPRRAVQGQFDYSTNADGITCTFTGYSGPGGDLTTPTNINGLTVTSIGDYSFDESSLTSVTIGPSVTSIGYRAFEWSFSLTNAIIPDSVTSIGDYAFWNCNDLASVMISDSLTNIGDSAFYFCSHLGSVTVSGGISDIGDLAFCSCCGLTNVTMSGGVNSAGISVFYGCSELSCVAISGGFNSIGDQAFYDCSSLTNIMIPSSVTNIASFAFYNCLNLTSVCFQGNAPAADSTVFDYDPHLMVYYLPGTTGWDGFSAATYIRSVPWNPLIQTDGESLGVRSNQFGFSISNSITTSIPIVVEACTNLASPVWTPLTNVMLTNTFHCSDPQWTNYPVRFYGLGMP